MADDSATEREVSVYQVGLTGKLAQAVLDSLLCLTGGDIAPQDGDEMYAALEASFEAHASDKLKFVYNEIGRLTKVTECWGTGPCSGSSCSHVR